MIFRKILFVVALCTLISGEIAAQCFGSPGNPAAGTSNLGTLNKNVVRVNLFHKFSYSDTYFTGHQQSDFVLYDKAYFNFLGNLIAWGVTNRFTLEAETGFFINKTIYYSHDLPFTLQYNSLNGYGPTQTVLSGKFLLLSDEKSPVKWSASAGAKIPLRYRPMYYNNTQLPVDVQPSNMAFGAVLQSYLLRENSFKGLRYFMINRYEYNFKNCIDYHWGQTMFNSLFLSKRLHFKQQWLTENWTAVFQLRHEMRTRNYNYLLSDPLVNASGSQLVFFTPQINYTAKEIWNFSLLFDIPLYQYYNGTQFGNKYAISLSVTRDFAPDLKTHE
jgi:hypothetical protein